MPVRGTRTPFAVAPIIAQRVRRHVPVDAVDRRRASRFQQGAVPDGRGADENAVPGGHEAQRTWTQRLPNWGEILGQLVISFEDRLTPYLK